jgi:hypothetical protein
MSNAKMVANDLEDLSVLKIIKLDKPVQTDYPIYYAKNGIEPAILE